MSMNAASRILSACTLLTLNYAEFLQARVWEIVFSLTYFWAKLKMDDITGLNNEPNQVKQRAAELRFDSFRSLSHECICVWLVDIHTALHLCLHKRESGEPEERFLYPGIC